MSSRELAITYIGGPTAIIEWGGLRLLTDPTFDPAGGEYRSPTSTLYKLTGPALTPDSVGPVDMVLLSHDHHSDNLDRAGRAFLGQAHTVITTVEGADRLGAGTVGLENWETVETAAPDGGILRITGTPARHGPAGMHRGAVIGFAVAFADARDRVLYISGDTVWFEGVEEVARRFSVRVAMLFLGAARVDTVGPFHLTMTTIEATQAARAFSEAAIVPIHYEGWRHFSESRSEIESRFAEAGLDGRINWLKPGIRTSLGRL